MPHRNCAGIVGSLALLGLLSCTHSGASRAPSFAALPGDGGYVFFGAPPAGDPWAPRIGGWQLRQRAADRTETTAPDALVPPPVSAHPGRRGRRDRAGSLAERYDAFVNEQRIEMAEEVLAWVQDESETRFVEDGPVDHWPTWSEMLESEFDDCDGLELLTYNALRALGFGEDRVYRSILHEPNSGQHHMVTLWFETPHDPWVLDPTATITSRLQRLSELEGWVALKVFSEHQNFTVTQPPPRYRY